MDSSTRGANSTRDPGLPDLPAPDPTAPAGVAAGRWALAAHAALWVLVILMQGVGLAASPTAAAGGSWWRLLLAVVMTAALVVVASRLGRDRPWTWRVAVALQVMVAVAYAWFTRLVLDQPTPGPISGWFVAALGIVLVVLSLVGALGLVWPASRRYCRSDLT